MWFILQQSVQRVGPGELEAEPVVQEALQVRLNLKLTPIFLQLNTLLLFVLAWLSAVAAMCNHQILGWKTPSLHTPP